MIDNKIQTFDYNSDHKALFFKINLNSIFLINKIDPATTHRFAFKKTKWKSFTKKLTDIYTNDIPNDRCLTIDEIYQKINSPNFINKGSKLKERVDCVAGRLISEFKENRCFNNRITTFSSTNLGSAPENIENSIPFMSPLKTNIIFF